MKKSAKPLHLPYPGEPFIEEFINRFGIRFHDVMSYASNCYRQRGSASIPNWEDFCYLPVNVAVGYCLELGMNDQNAAFNAKLLAAAQAFLASQLIVRMDIRELRAAWQDPCTGVIPYDDLMNVPTFGYYLDLAPIEAEAHGCGAFVNWEDRIGFAPTRGTMLHVVRGVRLKKRIDRIRFAPIPVEIPLLPGKTVRECMYKLLDDAMLNGLDANSPEIKHALGEPLEFGIDYASRLLRLVSLVNYKLAYEEGLPKYFEPVEFSDGAIVLGKCETLQI
jgi:hypothetical protein